MKYLLAMLISTSAHAAEPTPTNESIQAQDYMSEVDPNLRYIVEASNQLLPNMQDVKLTGAEVREFTTTQIRYVGIINLIQTLIVLIAGMIGLHFGIKMVNSPDNSNSDVTIISGIFVIIVSSLMVLLPILSFDVPLTQILAPEAWLLLRILP